MGSTEDSMDISFDAQSPLITPTLDRVDVSRRTHDEPPPLTPVPDDADLSLPTHYGTSSPPSPEWSLMSQQQDQQIQSQFDQLLRRQTSAAVLGVLLSLASIIQIHFPDTRISSLIKESKEMPLLLFILDKLYRLRQKLQMQDRYLQKETKDLKEYIIELQDECQKHGTIAIMKSATSITDSPFLVILARLKHMRPDIEPINYHRVTMSDFAIILGCILGRMGYYIDPNYGHTRSQLLQIGTAVACGYVKAQKPL